MVAIVLVAATRSADVLRHCVPRIRKVFPSASITVSTTSDDAETTAMSNALRVDRLTHLDPATLSLNGASYNYAALARSGIGKSTDWIILMRPSVMIDESLGNIDFGTLDKTSLYGVFFSEINKQSDLAQYKCTEPSPSEVREFSPSSEFLLFHESSGHKFEPWSQNTESAVESFAKNFAARYMIQLKLAHLGKVGENSNGRVSKWDETKPRIEPVHASKVADETTPKDLKDPKDPKEAQAKESKESKDPKEAQKELKHKEANDDKETMPSLAGKNDAVEIVQHSSIRREVESQQVIARNAEEVRGFVPKQKPYKNPFAVKLDEL